MFKMSAFSVDTGRQTTPPLVDGVAQNRLVQFAPDGDQTLAQLVDVLGRAAITLGSGPHSSFNLLGTRVTSCQFVTLDCVCIV